MSAELWLYVIAGLTGVTCALAGLFLVLRRMAMMADAVSHSILPGLVAGFWLANGPNLLVGFLGAVAAGMVTVAAVELLTKSKNVREDSAIGLVFPAMFALGVLWISSSFSNVHLDTDSVLFGEITTAAYDRLVVSGADYGPRSVWGLAFALLIVGTFLAVFKKELVAATFDPGFARFSGISPSVVHFSLMAVVATVTVAAFTAVGAILAVALVIVPTVCASLLSRKLGTVVWLAGVIGVVMSAVGTWTAIQADVSISGMIATLLGVLFVGCVAFAPGRGIVAAIIRRKRQGLEYAAQALAIHLAQHEGRSGEEAECHADHLVDELGWSAVWTETVVRWSVEEGWVVNDSGRLQLTSEGRKTVNTVARQIGLPLEVVGA